MELLFVLMGVANMASGTILRWRTQQALGIIWWAAALVVILGSDRTAFWTFILMTFVAELLFGIYLMLRGKPDTRHA